MCKVTHLYLIAPEEHPETDVATARDYNEALKKSADLYEADGIQRVIYVAVEISYRDPAPIKFRKVDGVKEAR